MLGGLNNQGNGGNTFSAYWAEMPSGFKFLVVSTLIIGLISIFTTLFAFLFADVVVWTVNYFQIWRLLTSFLVDRSIISVIFNLYIISMSLPIIEKMYSSAYSLLEIFTQTFLCNVIYILLGELFGFLGIVDTKMMASYGTMHLLFIFLWQRAALNPEEQTRFCCFPCVLPMKYLPWCFFALLALFSFDFYTIVGCLVGYFQHMIFKKSLLQLPMSFYTKFENCLPDSVKKSSGFVPIRSVESNLRSICRKSGASASFGSSGSRPQQQGNPFDNNEAMNDRVDAMGQGISIGSSSPIQEANPPDYKTHWLKNLNDEQVQARETQSPSDTGEKAQKKPGNLLDFSVEHNESLRSDYPLNDALEDEEEEGKKQLYRSEKQKSRNSAP